ncbi:MULTISPECIES: oligosaccharide flippase family protein [unclassified Clostridium]|uniref:oligosaccharide flippase family protein n=1 Tax=unclassified Clostridium TaxID=2614128 RepID=UPI0002975D7B|nr:MULTISPECIES: oligosaccharide flippase family protein [unclassified Clostridium]EKQ56941.1 MAG: membrane protein involved in the export of O-antigen and teichoic acid [Clostridium sp. Maddingley MBC34-26]
MSVIKNYIYNTLYQIMSLFIPLITMPYMTRIFTPDQMGLNSYTLSIVSYFMLFGMLGMQMYGNRQIAYVRDDKIKINRTFWSLFTTQLITNSISLIIYYCSILFYITEYKLVYVAQGLNIISVMLDISWLFMGLEDFKKIVIRNSLVKLIGVLSIFIFVKSSKDLILYIFLTAIISIGGTVIMWIYLPHYMKRVQIDLKIIKGTIKPLMALFLPQVATQVYTLLARTMVGVLSTTEQVAFYDYSQRIIRMILSLISSVGIVLMPRVANMVGKGQKEDVREVVKKTFMFISYISIPMAIGIMAISKILISWFLGYEYSVIGQLLEISSTIIVAVSWANIIGVQYLIATKQENKYTISILLAAAINLIMNVLVIGKYGAYGAVISLILAEFIGIGIQMILVRKQLPIGSMLISTIKYAMAAIIMAVIITPIGGYFKNGFVANVVQVIVGILVYISILFWMKDEIQNEVIDRCKELVLKRLINKIRILFNIAVKLKISKE